MHPRFKQEVAVGSCWGVCWGEAKVGLLSKGKSSRSQWGGQGTARQAELAWGWQAGSAISRHIYKVNRSTVKPEIKGGTSRSHGQAQAWGQHHSGRDPGQGLEHLWGWQWRGQPLMEPLQMVTHSPFPSRLQPSELAWAQPNLQSEDEVLQGLWMHPGLAPGEGNLPFLAAFPLHSCCDLQDCLSLASPQHSAGFYRLCWGPCSDCPLQCSCSAVAFMCRLKWMSFLLTSSPAW